MTLLSMLQGASILYYKVAWRKLFNAFDSKKWSNLLAVVELLFCLPIANDRVERVFFPS